MDPQASPFASPQTEIEPSGRDTKIGTPAGRGLRFLNYVIDLFAQLAMGIVFVVFYLIVGGDSAMERVENTPDFVVGILSILVYYIPLEAMGGRTLGKLVTGTKVVSEDGTAPSFGQVVGRTLCRFIPFEPFSILFGDDSRAWHDSIPHTYVIKSR